MSNEMKMEGENKADRQRGKQDGMMGVKAGRSFNSKLLFFYSYL